MGYGKAIIEFVFTSALFFNVLLFIPQSIKIIKERSAKGVSIVTFLGLLVIQFAIVLHGIITHDPILIWGYVLSMLSTGLVVILTIIFNAKNKKRVEFVLAIPEIFEQLPSDVYWKDLDLRYVGYNSNQGIVKQEYMVGKTDYDIYPKNEADQIRLNDELILRTKKSKLFKEAITGKDGNTIFIQAYKSPLYDDKGRVCGIVGISVDVTQSTKKTQEKLNMLDNIIAHMPGNVYWINRDGVYLGCNTNTAKAIGLSSRREIIGKKNIDLPGFLMPESLDPINEQVMSSGKAVTLEEPAMLADGSIATVMSSKLPLKNEKGEITGLLGISIDITERKKYEEDLKKSKEDAEKAVLIKNEFIKNMEHDLRTPYSGVLAMTQMLWETETDADKKNVLGHVVESAKKLLDYHNGILDFSNILSGNLSIMAKKFNIKEALKTVFSIEKPAATMSGLEFDFHLSDDLPSVVIGDENRLSRILLNIVGNAIKFTQKGSVSMSASLYEREKNFVIIRIEVRDTGMGIPQDKQQYIFEKFSRLTLSNKGKYSGLGIGLNIVKEFVEDIGAEIDLVSKPNQGTKFILSIPYKLPLTDDIIC